MRLESTASRRRRAGELPVHCEAVRFDVKIPRTVVRIPRVVESSELLLVRRHGWQQIRAECLLGEFSDAVHPPHVVVIIVQKSVPPFTYEGAISQRRQVQIRKYHFQNTIRCSQCYIVHFDWFTGWLLSGTNIAGTWEQNRNGTASGTALETRWNQLFRKLR